MSPIFRAIVVAAGSLALVATAVASADAAQRGKRVHARPLTVHKRSFVDNGKYPPIGSLQRYVTNDTQNNSPVYSNQADRFGLGVLPGRFGVFSPN